MSSLFGQLHLWIRKTTSSFALLCATPPDTVLDDAVEHRGLIYRLREWPALPEAWHTAPVFRALSVMSHRPVNRHWLIARQGMAPALADALIHYLVTHEAVDVVDAAAFARAPH
jgi:hypothetical protein